MVEGVVVSSLCNVYHSERESTNMEGFPVFISLIQAKANKAFSNSRVRVQLPRELDVGSNNTIVFCMLTWPEANVVRD